MDPTELKPEEFHPAARSAYRWLKGFMVTNPKDYARYKESIASAALAGNRQAEVCIGTIDRLAAGQGVSDRYLLGLCWTILHLHNFGAMERIADARLDRTYGEDESELKHAG